MEKQNKLRKYITKILIIYSLILFGFFIRDYYTSNNLDAQTCLTIGGGVCRAVNSDTCGASGPGGYGRCCGNNEFIAELWLTSGHNDVDWNEFTAICCKFLNE